MKITIELDSAEAKDFLVIKEISKAIGAVRDEKDEEPVETPVEDKPKAKRAPRKTKEEVEPAPEVKAEEPVEQKVEAPAEDLTPKTLVEPEVPEASATEAKAEEVEVITPEKWREIFANKRKELDIMPGSEYENFSPMFNDLVHKISETYGHRVPSKLTEEALTRFVHNDFVYIAWNADHTGFELSKAPF